MRAYRRPRQVLRGEVDLADLPRDIYIAGGAVERHREEFLLATGAGPLRSHRFGEECDSRRWGDHVGDGDATSSSTSQRHRCGEGLRLLQDRAEPPRGRED